jgi:hypothetical protein
MSRVTSSTAVVPPGKVLVKCSSRTVDIRHLLDG